LWVSFADLGFKPYGSRGSHLKVEEVYPNEYGTFEDAYENVWHFIEKVYNMKRLHSTLDYMSPD
jgi:hypothetical protein